MIDMSGSKISRSSRGLAADEQHSHDAYSSRPEKSYAISTDQGYRKVPLGSSGAMSASGSIRGRRSKTKEVSKKVSADRVKKNNPTKKSKEEAKTKTAKSSVGASCNSGQLDVVIFNPQYNEGNVPHWSFFVETHPNNRGLIRDVMGQPMGFAIRRVDDVLLEDSEHFRERIRIAFLSDVRAFEAVLESVPVQNDVAHWCCQDYIIEALDPLKEEHIIDNRDYQRVKRELFHKFNRGDSSPSSSSSSGYDE